MKNLKKILLIIMILITVISIDIKPVKAESKSKNIVTNNVYMLKKKKSSDNGVYNPDFDVDNFIKSKGSNKYKVNCSDFYYLQVAYRAMFFIGLFIYIIFAAFDFIKIVTAGNEEAIKKAKKNIPIRLGLFLLFLILPLIVRIFADRLGNTDTSAFKCIIGNSIEKK